jgi:hypothetical protein
MNAKEKAKEIYCKYAYALNIRDLQTTANPFVKQCALIAVEEILHCEATEPSDTDWDDCGATAQYYWPQKKVIRIASDRIEQGGKRNNQMQKIICATE